MPPAAQVSLFAPRLAWARRGAPPAGVPPALSLRAPPVSERSEPVSPSRPLASLPARLGRLLSRTGQARSPVRQAGCSPQRALSPGPGCRLPSQLMTALPPLRAQSDAERSETAPSPPQASRRPRLGRVPMPEERRVPETYCPDARRKVPPERVGAFRGRSRTGSCLSFPRGASHLPAASCSPATPRHFPSSGAAKGQGRRLRCVLPGTVRRQASGPPPGTGAGRQSSSASSRQGSRHHAPEHRASRADPVSLSRSSDGQSPAPVRSLPLRAQHRREG